VWIKIQAGWQFALVPDRNHLSCAMSGTEATQCAIHRQSWLHSTLHQLSIPLALMMGGIFDLLQPDAQGFHLQQPG
jgi:hypothetical protein